MTVRELIEALQKLPPDALVLVMNGDVCGYIDPEPPKLDRVGRPKDPLAMSDYYGDEDADLRDASPLLDAVVIR